MGNISKSYGHDAIKHKPKPVVRYVEGERVMVKQPLGVMERWVDLQGNVMSLQLRKLGDPPDQGIVDRARARYRRDGWCEHHQCPLTNGAMRSDKVAADLKKRPPELRDACEADPQTIEKTARGVELRNGCPHVEWLIKHRTEKELDRRKTKRGSRPETVSQADLLAKAIDALGNKNAPRDTKPEKKPDKG